MVNDLRCCVKERAARDDIRLILDGAVRFPEDQIKFVLLLTDLERQALPQVVCRDAARIE